ncbi:MAG: amidohydrolase [Actinobacteria bacterium]|nr:amidohydrolase [Actinomycetota bacterium]
MTPTDVHNHVIPAEAVDLLNTEPVYGARVVDGMWQGVHHVPFEVTESFLEPAAKIAELDREGIGAAVVSPPPPLFFYEVSPGGGERLCEATNEGMQRFCAHDPQRLRWLASLPMQDPGLAVRCYLRALDAGCCGAAIGTSIAGRRLDAGEYEPFWDAAERAGRPVLLHPAFNEQHAALEGWYLQNVIGNPLETTVVVERLICAGVLERHPGLRLIILHGGGYVPYQIGRLRHARRVRAELAGAPEDVTASLRQLYFDTITHDLEALRFLARRVGVDHVVLGTDLPFDMAMRAPIDALAEAFGEETVRRIAEENPAVLFGLAAVPG